MNDVQTVRKQLAASNPVSSGPLDSAQSDAMLTALQRILSTPRQPDAMTLDMGVSRRHPRRLLVPGAVATTAAVLAVTFFSQVGGSRPSYAATPPPLQFTSAGLPAARLLLSLAHTAVDQPPSVSTGDYKYFKIQTWDLSTAVKRRGANSVVIPTVRETWIGPKVVRVVQAKGKAIGPSDTSIEQEQQAAREASTAKGAEVTLYRDGSYQLYPITSETLRQRVLTPNSQIPDSIEAWVAIVDRLHQQPMPWEVLAAVYRVLAGIPGVIDRGAVRDRAGRPGVAISLDSAYGGLPTRYYLIIDPRTGKPLGDEQVLTTSAGKLNVQIPAVINYTTYLTSGNVPSDTARPRT